MYNVNKHMRINLFRHMLGQNLIFLMCYGPIVTDLIDCFYVVYVLVYFMALNYQNI